MTGQTLQQLYAGLSSSLQFHVETAQEAVRSEIPPQMTCSPNVPKIMKVDILFAGQGVYGRPHKGVGDTWRASPGGGGGGSGRGEAGPAGVGSGDLFEPLTVAG